MRSSRERKFPRLSSLRTRLLNNLLDDFIAQHVDALLRDEISDEYTHKGGASVITCPFYATLENRLHGYSFGFPFFFPQDTRNARRLLMSHSVTDLP